MVQHQCSAARAATNANHHLTFGDLCRYGDDELELYELVRKLEYNATKIAKKLCKKDCKRAAKVQAEEARKKYVEDYEEWEKRQSWAKELGYEEHVPMTAEEVAEKKKEIDEEKKKRRKTGAPASASQLIGSPECPPSNSKRGRHLQQVAKRSTAKVTSFEPAARRRLYELCDMGQTLSGAG
jgi:hypothetical protein